MGTNYYWKSEVEEPTLCSECRCVTKVPVFHIGKSSAGWTFTFQTSDALGVRSFADWKRVLAGKGTIVDEYGAVLPVERFEALVVKKASALHSHAREHPQKSFLDPEGHSFSDYDFS